MSKELVATWADVALVVFATSMMYGAFLLLVRLVGPRSLAQLSSIDLGFVVMTGSVMGRTALLITPTLTRGLVAISTLFTVRGILWLLRRSRSAERAMSLAPIMLMSGSQLLAVNMRKAHVTENDLRQELRAAGVRRRDEVEAVILERNGRFSIVRQAAPAERWLLADLYE